MASAVFNLGSLNIDLVYNVPHFVRPGETLASTAHDRLAGGKGLNQSTALAAAGASVHHIGAIGADGRFLREQLSSAGVGIANIEEVELPTGHAVIQVTDSGENAILLHAGANHALTPSSIAKGLESSRPGDWFLTQNETSCVIEGMRAARRAGLRVCFNPSPITTSLQRELPLDTVELLVLNQTEGEALTGRGDHDAIVDGLRAANPELTVVLTLGASGIRFAGPEGEGHLPAPAVEPVDTTAAGDTFLGFLLGRLTAGERFKEALRTAVHAAAIAVTRPGASASIPTLQETAEFLETGIPPRFRHP